jgi:hypothetical protein
MKFQKIAIIISCIAFIISAFFNLQTFITAGQAGLILISRAVLPILFPFFVISGLLINLLPANKFNIIALSLLSGYPNGARLTAMLYKKNAITETQAQNLVIITSTVSPIFAVATVGTVLLGDIWLGFIIFTATVLGAFINGFIWQKNRHPTDNKSHSASLPASCAVLPAAGAAAVLNDASLRLYKNFNFNGILLNSIKTIFNICGIILICYIAAALLHLPPLLSGIIEMTTGVSQITMPYIICFILSFGGISIALQSFIFTNDLGISPLRYFAFKLTHAILATGILAVFSLI